MKALGLEVSDKKTYFFTLWPTLTYATNWNGLNNFGRGTPRDHSQFGKNTMSGFREVVWMKKLMHKRTDGRRTKDCHKSSFWALCAQVSLKAEKRIVKHSKSA